MDKLSNSELLQLSTVRLECAMTNGQTSVGTGFYFAFENTETEIDRIAIITNKHVIKDSINLTIWITPIDNDKKPNYTSNFKTTISIMESDWIEHPDTEIDLCILPFHKFYDDLVLKVGKFFIFAYTKKYLANSEKLNSLNAIETITMIGYPNGIWDKTNNLPVIRQGITASHPKLNYNGKSEILIDCACFPGSSGSPVLVYNHGGYATKEGNFDVQGRLILLGILYSGPLYLADGEIVINPISTLPNIKIETSLTMNLGIIIKSEKILDFDTLIKI
ncbi:serine protease [Leptospira sp. WS4.C2]